jgi:hypothetical protein
MPVVGTKRLCPDAGGGGDFYRQSMDKKGIFSTLLGGRKRKGASEVDSDRGLSYARMKVLERKYTLPLERSSE